MNTSIYSIKAPAKVNIRLKVTGRRPDGYHELVSIMVPVDLFDILELKVHSGGQIKIQSKGFEVPTDENNLIYLAARLFMSRTGINNGASITLLKNIPVAAGLGGGSSDAASTLLALNRIYSSPLSDSDLHDLAVKLGADVPFFLNSRPSLATGIGDILKPIPNWPELWYLIITPPIEVSTSWVYKNLKLELTTGEYHYILHILKKDTFSISRILENDLETVTSASFPIINTLKKLLMDAGAEGAIMSGSGPSVFGVFLSSEKAAKARDALASGNLGNVFVVRGESGIIRFEQ
ncbi:4-(cytidine 5'-diphospho)-2-C-methyl-D-erythritol kinase [Deltaproteobacteria bacterium]|nr:4-(cytidine 5'-diphospho)-2-C-methyl-D-erythritol kinase [Deltaproteobacteria bacterium]